MPEKSYVRFERGERVDQPDLDHVAVRSGLDAIAQLVEALIVGPDGEPTVLWGWDVVLASPVITVTRGAAITGFRERGRLYRGIVLSGGPASRSTSVATLPNGTYGVVVRFTLRPAAVHQRRAWNALGAPPAEVSRLMATRFVEDWDLVLERASPGPEYLQLGTVPVAGGALGLFSRRAPRLFDSARGNRVLTDAEWGGALDRDETDLDGLRGLTRWTRMVMRQLQDIIGVTFFGDDPQGGSANGNGPRSLSQLNGEKLGRSGAQAMTGNLLPDANGARDLGSAATRWREVFAQTVSYAANIVSAAAGSVSWSLSGGASPANESRVVNTINSAAGGTAALLQLFAGVAAQGRLELLADEVRLNPGTRALLDDRRLRFENASATALGANPPVATGVRNELSAKSIAKAWVTVEPTGGGAFVIHDGLNVAGVAWQGFSLRITFAEPMSSPRYVALGTWNHQGVALPLRLVVVADMAPDFVDLQVVDVARQPPAAVDLSRVAGGQLMVAVFATQ